jgi:hypothetical protein
MRGLAGPLGGQGRVGGENAEQGFAVRRPWHRSARRQPAGRPGCTPGAAAGPRSSGNGWRSSRIGPTRPAPNASRSGGSGRIPPGWSRPPTRRQSTAWCPGQCPDHGSDQIGSVAQPLVVARLLGQVAKQVPKVGVGMAQPAGLGGEPEQGLHHRQGDQLRVGQPGHDADLRRHGAHCGCCFSRSSVLT